MLDYNISLVLNPEDSAVLDAQIVRDTLEDLRELLREIERGITGEKTAHARWGVPDPQIELVASVNGVSASALDAIVGAAYDGFRLIAEHPRHPSFEGTGISPAAERHLRAIASRLSELESIIVAAAERPSFELRGDPDQLPPATARTYRRVYSEVTGILRMIAGFERTIRASITEQGTNARVRVTLDHERWKVEVAPLWERVVVVRGMVLYRDDGRPVSVTDVQALVEKPTGRPLTDFIGILPGLTGELKPEELIARLRGREP